ncbi:MAG: OmpA family protein [Bacteroidales bacterium]|nr:OmpA family protein [Bacteroidales bacterium]
MKKLFFVLAAACIITPAFAQEVKRTEDDKTITIVEETQTPEGKVVTTTTIQKDRVFVNGFWHNWEIAGGLGTQLYYGENDWKMKNKLEMFAFPSIDLMLTKWASPSFGVGIGANVSQFKGIFQGTNDHMFSTRFKTNEPYTGETLKDYGYEKLTKQRGYYGNVYALAHADLANMLFGYKADRFFTVDAYAGGGVLFGITDKAIGATFNVGLAPKFRVTERLSIMLNLRGSLISDDFEGESSMNEPDENHFLANHKLDGIAGGTLGLAWKIGKNKSRWENASRTSTIYYNDAALARRDSVIRSLTNNLDDADNTIRDLKDKLQNAEHTEYITEVPDLWFHINFIVDRWDLLNREKVNLQSVADVIKSTPSIKYLLCGYADKQTATPSHNLMLSKNRVEAVYDYLTKELGVDADQLVTDYKGGVDYMFYNEKELSRCCMITAIKE